MAGVLALVLLGVIVASLPRQLGKAKASKSFASCSQRRAPST